MIMKRNYLYMAIFALLMGACSDELTEQAIVETPEVNIPQEATEGELLVKFVPEMTDILDETLNSCPVGSRSGIPSTDEVLSILGAYHLNVYFLSILKQKNVHVKQVCICGM